MEELHFKHCSIAFVTEGYVEVSELQSNKQAEPAEFKYY